MAARFSHSSSLAGDQRSPLRQGTKAGTFLPPLCKGRCRPASHASRVTEGLSHIRGRPQGRSEAEGRPLHAHRDAPTSVPPRSAEGLDLREDDRYHECGSYRVFSEIFKDPGAFFETFFPARTFYGQRGKRRECHEFATCSSSVFLGFYVVREDLSGQGPPDQSLSMQGMRGDPLDRSVSAGVPCFSSRNSHHSEPFCTPYPDLL